MTNGNKKGSPKGRETSCAGFFEKSLEMSDTRSRLAMEASQTGVVEWHIKSNTFFFDDIAANVLMVGGTAALCANDFLEQVAADDRGRVLLFFNELLVDEHLGVRSIRFKLDADADGDGHELELLGQMMDDGLKGPCFIGVVYNLAPQNVSDHTIALDEHAYKHLFDNVNANFALHEIILNDEGKAIDYRFLDVNSALAETVGLKPNDMIGKTARELFPSTEQYWVDKFAQVADSGKAAVYENYSVEINRHYEMKIFSPRKGLFGILATDITDQVVSRSNLKQLKDHFEQLFNLYPDAVSISRMSDGFFVDVNVGYSFLTGYARNEVIGKTSKDIDIWVNHHERDVYVDILVEKGECFDFVSEFRCKDGRIFFGQISAVLLYTYDAPHILSVTRDITRNKQDEEALRESERALRQSQEVARLGTYKLDFKTGLWVSSSILNDIFGIDDSTVKDIALWETIIHPKWRDRMVAYLQEHIIVNHERFDKEYKIINQKTKAELWIHGLGELLFDEDGNLLYMLGTIQNIDSRKRAEIIIQEQNKELSELNTTKNKLFSIIAHDLRNPFSALLGFSEMLMGSIEAYDKDNIRKLASHMHTMSMQTYVLLENLLEWFQIQTGHLAPKLNADDLKSILHHVVLLARELALRKGIGVFDDIQPNTMVVCDIDMTRTVIRNLVFNAIKFTSYGGKIMISATSNDSEVQVSVSDTGVGISGEVVPKLFSIDKNNVTNGTNNETGSGLGLHICKELVEKQGGRIWVESELGKGSVFYFTLPIGKLLSKV
jgi:PAS domain S-box-containing protein